MRTLSTDKVVHVEGSEDGKMSLINQSFTRSRRPCLRWRSTDSTCLQSRDTKVNSVKTGRTSRMILLLLSLLLSLLPATGKPSFARAQEERKQVLYINAYHPGYKWSDDNTRAIKAIFAEEGNIDLRIEYLDSKRIDSQEYLEMLSQLFEIKYANAQPDLIMSSDDVALNFLFKYADTLFPNVPVVFIGANYFDETRLKGYERFTGISEEADIAGTLDVALSLQPEVTRVVVVNDTSVTGQKVHGILTEILPQYPQISFEFLEDVTMEEVRRYVGTLSPDTLVLITIFFRDKAGGFYEYDQFTSIISESSSVPVYGTWDFSLGFGIVGGKLTSGYTEGERGAKVAVRILNGEDPRGIPVEKQAQSQYLFDYNVMEKWGIEVSQLPEESTVINRPVSFYEENKLLIWGVFISFIVLIFIIIFLSINNNQRRRAQEELTVSNRELEAIRNSLEQRVADRTKALATSAEVSRRLSTILNEQQLIIEVAEQVKAAFNYYHVHMYLLDETSGDLIMAGGTGDIGASMLVSGHKIPKGTGLVGRSVETAAPILITDVSQEPGWLPNPLLPETQSEAAVPISIGSQVLGVLDVQHNEIGGLRQEDVDLLQTLANQVAIALQNARSYSDVHQRAEREALITSIGQKIQSTTSVEHALQTAAHELGRTLGINDIRVILEAPVEAERARKLNSLNS